MSGFPDQLEESEKVLRKAIELKPNDYEAYYCLGYTLGLSNRVEDAMHAVLEAIKLNPGFQQGYLVLGDLMQKGNQHETAKTLYREALRHDGNMMAVRERLAELYMRENNVAAATTERQEIVTRRGTSEDWVEFGVAKMAGGDGTGAFTAFQRAATLEPLNWHPHYQLGRVFDRAGEDARAKQEFELAIKYNPADFKPYNGLGLLLLKMSKTKEAITHLKKAADLAPDSPIVTYNLALAHTKAKKNKQAREYIDLVIKNPRSGELANMAEKLLVSMPVARPVRIRS